MDCQVRGRIILYRRSRIIVGSSVPLKQHFICCRTIRTQYSYYKHMYTYLDRRLLHTIEYWLRTSAGVVLVAWWLGDVFAVVLLVVVK